MKDWFFFVSVVVLALLFITLGALAAFRIQSLAVQGNQKVTAEEIYERLSGFTDENLLVVDLSEVAKKLLQDRRIAGVEVRRIWPNQLLVIVKEKEPVFLVKTSQLWGLTAEGEIVPADTFDNAQLPQVKGVKSSNWKAYSLPASPELQQLLVFYRAVKSESDQMLSLISEIELSRKRDLTLILAFGHTKVYLGHQDFEKKLSRLTEILGLGVNGNLTIDLRFENQAIVKETKADEA